MHGQITCSFRPIALPWFIWTALVSPHLPPTDRSLAGVKPADLFLNRTLIPIALLGFCEAHTEMLIYKCPAIYTWCEWMWRHWKLSLFFRWHFLFSYHKYIYWFLFATYKWLEMVANDIGMELSLVWNLNTFIGWLVFFFFFFFVIKWGNL